MISKHALVEKIAKRLANTKSCGVEGCESTAGVDLVEIKPFDPIDHDSTFVALCSYHQQWGDRRNDFAEQMADELREARKEIGQEHIETIQELSMPQDGDLREDILMADVEEDYVPLEDAFEDDHQTGLDLLEDRA